MRIRLLCFGRLRDLLGDGQMVELPEVCTAAQLWQQLVSGQPELAPYGGSVAIAVNQEFASAATALHDGDEVALLPPVSGGCPAPEAPAGGDKAALSSAHARLQWEPIDAVSAREGLVAPEDGALCAFEGVVRNHSRNRRTLYLDYEGYPAMAVAEMERLATQALAQCAVRDVRIVHRLGRMEIGECSVLILVASAHRVAAFEACRWMIDQLKKSVPIWKKEHFEDGAVWADGEPFPPELAL